MTRPDRSAQQLSDTLHRALAKANAGRCWLLIDPSVRPLQAEEELAVLMPATGAQTTIASCPDRRIEAAELPLLLPLVSTRSADSAVLAASIEEALAELDATKLAHGLGRRIAGWLQSSASTSAIAQHIGEQLIQRRPGRTTLLHWIDPPALWAIWPVLDAQQQATLMGPIHTYRLLDPAGGLTTLHGAGLAGSPTRGALNLTPAQWSDADAVGALNAALRDWGAENADPQALAAARGTGLAALRRARVRGFTRSTDLTAYAHRALRIGAHFDTHPLVRQRLDTAEPGAYLNAVLDDLTPDDWQRIAGDTLNPPSV